MFIVSYSPHAVNIPLLLALVYVRERTWETFCAFVQISKQDQRFPGSTPIKRKQKEKIPFHGAPSGIRTRDPLIKSQLLYLLPACGQGMSIKVHPPAGACLRSLRARGKPFMLCASFKTRSAVSRFKSYQRKTKKKTV